MYISCTCTCYIHTAPWFNFNRTAAATSNPLYLLRRGTRKSSGLLFYFKKFILTPHKKKSTRNQFYGITKARSRALSKFKYLLQCNVLPLWLNNEVRENIVEKFYSYVKPCASCSVSYLQPTRKKTFKAQIIFRYMYVSLSFVLSFVYLSFLFFFPPYTPCTLQYYSQDCMHFHFVIYG